MKEKILEILPTLITILGTLFVWIRYIIKITNKSIVDIILQARNVTIWDDFIEMLFISMILVVACLAPIFLLEFNVTFLNVILKINLLLFFITLIIIIIYWVCSLFKQVKGKLLVTSIVINYLLIFFLPFILLYYIKDEFLEGLKVDIVSFIIIFLTLVIHHCMLISFYPSILKYFIKPEIKRYKIERIQTSNDVMKNLYFLYMLDNERHVLSKSSNINKIGSDPFYIYYPKEDTLIRYFK